MALEVNHEKPFRSHPRRLELINAILGADDVDENGWIEWKTDIDLTQTAGQFRAARAILSFANRTVASAARYAEGTAYLILGASHNHDLPGVTPVDGADIAQTLAKYLGNPSAMVDWDASYLQLQGKSVLVFTIEAPQPGDRFAALNREYDKYQEGVIFVRDGSRTVNADADHIRQLEERLLAGRPSGPAEIDLKVVPQHPQGWTSLDFREESVSDWLRLRQAAVRSQSRSRTAYGVIPETSFMESVQSYMDRCAETVPYAVAGALARMRRNQLAFRVTNPSDETVKDGDLLVNIAEGWRAWANVFKTTVPKRQSGMVLPFVPRVSNAINISPGQVRLFDQGRRLIYHLGDIRPRRSVSCEVVTLTTVFDELRGDEHVDLTWAASSTERRGLVEGKLTVSVAGQLPLRQLIGQPSDGI